jgi:hypothetical protein
MCVYLVFVVFAADDIGSKEYRKILDALLVDLVNLASDSSAFFLVLNV